MSADGTVVAPRTLALTASQYNVLMPLKDGRWLAHNGMSEAFALLERTDVAAYEAVLKGDLEGIPLDSLRALLQGGFVVPASVSELDELQRRYVSARGDVSGLVATIAPTLACNFACDYCFQGEHKPAGKMTATVQDAVVRLIDSLPTQTRRVHVAWYGGEPLLALDVIEALSSRILETVGRKGLHYDATMVSNGFRLDKKTADRLVELRVASVQITLDGGAASHDRRRILLSGKPTFDRIIRNITSVVLETSLSISARINIDSRNADSVPVLLEQLAAAGLGRRKNFGVYFAPVEAITEGCHVVADVCLSKAAYGHLEAELTRKAYDLGLCGLPYPRPFRGLCGAVRPQGLVVTPSGDVHKCWDTVSMPSHRVGTIFDDNCWATGEGALPWLRWTPFENQACRACKLLPTCAGSCAHKFVNPEQTKGEAAELPCPSWKYNIKQRLLLRAEKSGFISRDDYDGRNALGVSDDFCVTSTPIPPHSNEEGVAVEGRLR